MTRQVVYFLRPVGMPGPVKIGCSATPDGRRRTLEAWSPFPLEIVAQIEGDFPLERQFHAKFLDSHSHSEWFKWSPELEAVISAIRDGTFDTAALPGPQRLPRRAGGARTGGKWSEERKAMSRRWRALTKVENETTLVLDYPHTDERVDAFVAAPLAHGITRIERQRRVDSRIAQHKIQEAAALFARARI